MVFIVITVHCVGFWDSILSRNKNTTNILEKPATMFLRV
jgi:hypothetical protein